MPELPEVHQLKNELHKACFSLRREGLDLEIQGVQASNFPLRWGLSPRQRKSLKGLVWTGVHRRAKYLLFEFQAKTKGGEPGSVESVFLLSHLGMTGQWRVATGPKPQLEKHEHFSIEFAECSLIYKDPRRFGFLETLKDVELSARFQELGPEPLSFEWTVESGEDLKSLRKQNRPIKSVLMDGKWVVGVGNIYASESLFRSRLSPFFKPSQLSANQWKDLQVAVRSVLVEAILSGGSTIRDYVRADGQKGGYQHHLWVYGRQGQPCKICKAPIELARISGRGTFYCPSCQSN